MLTRRDFLAAAMTTFVASAAAGAREPLTFEERWEGSGKSDRQKFGDRKIEMEIVEPDKPSALDDAPFRASPTVRKQPTFRRRRRRWRRRRRRAQEQKK